MLWCSDEELSRGCIVVSKEGCDISVAHAEEVVKPEDRALSGR